MQKKKPPEKGDKPAMGKVVAHFVSTRDTRIEDGRARPVILPANIAHLISDMTPEDQEAFGRGFKKLKINYPFGAVNAVVADFLQKSVEQLPQSTLDVPIPNDTQIRLSEPAVSALAGTEVKKVGDFVTMTPAELEGILPRDVIREIRETLLGCGIRTIDNPPPKSE